MAENPADWLMSILAGKQPFVTCAPSNALAPE